ncbi:MAG: ANTAR domain-containing protein [Actinomycetota bacterium]|nr:ANTAR domain-containing protein [Actinomycetota bacterium]
MSSIETPVTFELAVLGPGSSHDKAVIAGVRRVDSSVCLPILLIGGYSADEGMNWALSSSADDYLGAPLSSEFLGARIHSLLAARHRSELALTSASDRTAHLERALDTNRCIGIALGILMATEKITADLAFQRLKAASQKSNRKLRDIADDVIYTGALAEHV